MIHIDALNKNITRTSTLACMLHNYNISVAYLTHTTYSGIVKHNQKIKEDKKMFKIILNKIKELKYYSYDSCCYCKICKFLRLTKIK